MERQRGTEKEGRELEVDRRPGISGIAENDPYNALTPRGRRQLQEYLKIIKRVKKVIAVRGKVHGVTIKIILDKQVKYDTVTMAAIEGIERVRRMEKRKANRKDIPAHLQQERGMEFFTTKCEVDIRGNCLSIKPLIIKEKIPCITMGKASANKMCKIIANKMK